MLDSVGESGDWCRYCGSCEHDSWTCPTVICDVEVQICCEFCGSSDHETLQCRDNAMTMVEKLHSHHVEQPARVDTMDEDIAQELAIVEEQLRTSTDTELLYDMKERKAALTTFVENKPSSFKQGILESVPCMCCDSEHHNMLSCPSL